MANYFKGQKPEKIRQTQLKSKSLFIDPLFPPNNSSLYLRDKAARGKIVWKRPGEIVSNPKIVSSALKSGDAYQGQLGNCWFVAACSVLAGVKELWHKVIPDYKEQEKDLNDPNEYVGMFYCRFYRFGAWVDVVIDDLLPTMNGKLIYAHSRSKDEFWCALLEKAYAKINGCYEALDSGNLSDALLDFTGGISESVDIRGGKYATDEEKRSALFKLLLKQKQNFALMCCSIEAKSRAEIETRNAAGLVKGHAYSITDVRKVNVKETRLFAFLRGREKLNMVRLRNPWGNGREWNGPFSDGSPEWQRISSAEREKLGLTFEEDGEFWMTMEDFVKYFTDLSVCHLLNTSLFTFSRRWINGAHVYGEWTKDRAGGCANHIRSFLQNPQYCFDIGSDDEEIIIQLMQPDVREKRRENASAENIAIGLHLLKVEENRLYRVHSAQFLNVAGRSDYIHTRSILLRQSIGKGRYVILPTTFKPGQFGSYLLRFFATCHVNFRELEKDAPKPSFLCCATNPSLVTTISVRKFTGLLNVDRSGGLDPYCIIYCEGKSVRSQVVRNAQNEAVWDVSAIFYRKRPQKSLTIAVWNHNLVRDTYIGEVSLEASSVGGRMLVKMDLTKKGSNKKMETVPGRISVEYQTSNNLTDF